MRQQRPRSFSTRQLQLQRQQQQGGGIIFQNAPGARGQGGHLGARIWNPRFCTTLLVLLCVLAMAATAIKHPQLFFSRPAQDFRPTTGSVRKDLLSKVEGIRSESAETGGLGGEEAEGAAGAGEIEEKEREGEGREEGAEEQQGEGEVGEDEGKQKVQQEEKEQREEEGKGKGREGEGEASEVVEEEEEAEGRLVEKASSTLDEESVGDLSRRGGGAEAELLPSEGGRRRGVEEEEVGEASDDAEAEGRKKPAVEWRGAMWQHGIGRWFQDCSSSLLSVEVCEPLLWTPSKICPENCNGRGVCNRELGKCVCHMGYKGPSCSDDDLFPCNHPVVPDFPIGWWSHVMCAAECDQRTQQCFCGSGTKYPTRPATYPCGLAKTAEGHPMWQKLDLDPLFSTDKDSPGWCNADPDQVLAGKVHSNTDCFCNADGWRGRFCEVPVEMFCLNQCSLRGRCKMGFCLCDEGWYGVDCSIPAAETSGDLPWSLFARTDRSSDQNANKHCQEKYRNERPAYGWVGGGGGQDWRGGQETLALEAADVGRADAAGKDGDLTSLERELLAAGGEERDEAPMQPPDWVASIKQRPLVYVYELPPEFNVEHLQARTWRFTCVHRLYDEANQTIFDRGQLYGMEMVVTEAFLSSPHRTLNPLEADYFFVPVFGACVHARGPDDAPRLDMEPQNNIRIHYSSQMYHDAFRYISAAFPFWNRTQGKDHIWLFSWDEGACAAPQSIWNGITMGPWGNTMSSHPKSTTQYGSDIWDLIPKSLRGDHPCFDPKKDIVLPAWTFFYESFLDNPIWRRDIMERTRLFYFNGNLGLNYSMGRPEPDYSMGIRQRVAEHFASVPNLDGRLGKLSEPGVEVTNQRSHSYSEELASSQFCGVFPGDGFSARMEAAMLHGCIPVIIQDGIQLPFENFLDYDTFAVRISEADIPKMVEKLKAIDMEKRKEMMRNVQNLRLRWSYHSVDRQEVERQKVYHKREKEKGWAPWMMALEELKGKDDAVSTIFEILHYKLYHDNWRETRSSDTCNSKP